MTSKPVRDAPERSDELLLAEHRYVADSFWRNEEAGEKRVNFFITLVTAVLAALVALATKQGSLSDEQVGGLAFAACLSLLGVGTLTFRRLIHRNRVADGYKAWMDHIRNQFRAWDPRGLAGYDPFPAGTGGARRFGRGGLTDLVAAVNSVIAAAALAALVAALSGSLALIAPVAVVSVVLSLAVHAAYLEHSYHGTWMHPLWKRLLSRGRELREVESSLVVVSETPEVVLGEIEALHEIAGHALEAARSERIHDRYLDTSDRRLEKRKIALRVRELDGEMLVTLKGPAAIGRWGGEDRLELERSWSEEAWQKVRAELDRRGVATRAASASPLSPLETLAAAGFEIIQDREVERRVRNLRPRDGGQGRAAELALDTVTYHFSTRDLRHYEVEIEAKARRGAEAVATVATALVDLYWPQLRPWRHAKLPTGKAVADLLGDGRAGNLVRPDGALEPQAYDAIAELLGRDPDAATAAMA